MTKVGLTRDVESKQVKSLGTTLSTNLASGACVLMQASASLLEISFRASYIGMLPVSDL